MARVAWYLGRRLAVGAVVLFFVLISPAHSATPEWVYTANHIADQTWGPAPCEITLAIEDLPFDNIANSRWDLDDAGAKINCLMRFDPDELALLTWPEFCHAFVHERGHFGRFDERHSANPHSVMYPVLTGFIFKPCRVHRLWYTGLASKQPRRS